MKWAVDGDNVALSQSMSSRLSTRRQPISFSFSGDKRLVVEVEELLAVECLQPAEHTLTDTANSNGTDDLVLEVVLVLGNSGDVPVTGLDLLVSGHEVADEDEDGHDDVLGDRNDVGASDFGNGDTAIGLVGSVEVDVVRSNTGSDGNLEVLRLCETLCREVARVETERLSALISSHWIACVDLTVL